ncbi:MAG: hypothetical protein WC566_05375 [Dehalococcoidia bacterium]
MQNKIVKVIRKTIPDDSRHVWVQGHLSGLLHERFACYNHGISIEVCPAGRKKWGPTTLRQPLISCEIKVLYRKGGVRWLG